MNPCRRREVCVIGSIPITKPSCLCECSSFWTPNIIERLGCFHQKRFARLGFPDTMSSADRSQMTVGSELPGYQRRFVLPLGPQTSQRTSSQPLLSRRARNVGSSDTADFVIQSYFVNLIKGWERSPPRSISFADLSRYLSSNIEWHLPSESVTCNLLRYRRATQVSEMHQILAQVVWSTVVEALALQGHMHDYRLCIGGPAL